MPPSSHHQLWLPHKHSLQFSSHQAKSYFERPQMQVTNRSVSMTPEPEEKAGLHHPAGVYWVVVAVLSAICLTGVVSIIAWLILRNRISRSNSDWYIVTTEKDLHMMKEAKLCPVGATLTHEISDNATGASANQTGDLPNNITQHRHDGTSNPSRKYATESKYTNGENSNGIENKPNASLDFHFSGISSATSALTLLTRKTMPSSLKPIKSSMHSKEVGRYPSIIVYDDMTDSSTSTSDLEKTEVPEHDPTYRLRPMRPVHSCTRFTSETKPMPPNDTRTVTCPSVLELNERTSDTALLDRLHNLLPRLPSQAFILSPSIRDLSLPGLRRSCTDPTHFNSQLHFKTEEQASALSPGHLSPGERESITSTLLQMLVDSKNPNEPYLLDESLPPPSIIVSPPTGSTLSIWGRSELREGHSFEGYWSTTYPVHTYELPEIPIGSNHDLTPHYDDSSRRTIRAG